MIMPAMSKTIYVYDSFSDSEPQLMGRLYVDLIRGRESYSFEGKMLLMILHQCAD